MIQWVPVSTIPIRWVSDGRVPNNSVPYRWVQVSKVPDRKVPGGRVPVRRVPYRWVSDSKVPCYRVSIYSSGRVPERQKLG